MPEQDKIIRRIVKVPSTPENNRKNVTDCEGVVYVRTRQKNMTDREGAIYIGIRQKDMTDREGAI